MEKLLIAFAAALAIGLPALATAWAQSKIGAAGAGTNLKLVLPAQGPWQRNRSFQEQSLY
jgi:hypothetical protein